MGSSNKRGPFREARLYCKLSSIRWGGQCHFPSGGAGFLPAPLAATFYSLDVRIKLN